MVNSLISFICSSCSHAGHAAGKIFGGGMVSGIIFRRSGIFSMGLRYALTIVLPVITSFFFFTAGGQRLSARCLTCLQAPFLLGLNGRPSCPLRWALAVAPWRWLGPGSLIRGGKGFGYLYWPWECPVRPSWLDDLLLSNIPGAFLAGPWWRP